MFHRDVIGAAVLWRRRGISASLLDRRAGECFLEAVAVAGLIAVLTGLAASDAGLQMAKSMLTEAASLTLNHRVEASEYLAVRGTLPGDGEPYAADEIRGRYVSSVAWQDSEIVVTLDLPFLMQLQPTTPADPAADAVPTVAFRIARAPATGRQIFLCGRAEPPPGYTAAAPVHTSLPEEQLPYFCRF